VNKTSDIKLTMLYIAIAYLFSIALRMVWVSQFSGYEPFMFNGQFMINTNDGYYFAEGARDIMAGFHQPNDGSPINHAVSELSAFFASVLPFSFESIIFYLPSFLSSLVVVPIILIAKRLKNLEMGFIAALLASVAWSYYNRTMVGYFDTDMLNIVLPMFLLWSIIWAIDTNKDRYLLITALDILVYRWWYPQSYALEFSFFILILLYALIFDRKNLYNYKLLAMMMFAMLNLDGYIRFPLVLAVFYLFRNERFDKYIYHILGVSIGLFFISGGFNPIWIQLKHYVFKESMSAVGDGLSLKFYNVHQTVREAGQIQFETFANRISGHTITFLLSFVGYIYLCYRHKIMIFALPLVGLGFLAMFGGLRFTIYAVPILAFGVAFLITELSLKMPTTKLKYLSMVAFTLSILYPNYKHIESYRVPTVFSADEVNVLEKLHDIATREDYVVTWWDYGFPIRYYSDVKTLVDGGHNTGSLNFPVSFVLTNPQDVAAKMARLDVEYTESKEVNKSSNIEQMTLDYGLDDTNDFLLSLQTDIKLPKKTRDVYIYLPHRMLNIYPTVKVFSNIDLMSGAKKKSPFFFVSKNFKDTKDRVYMGNGISLDKKTNSIMLGKQKVPLKRIVRTAYDRDMKLHKNTQTINFGASLSLIYMADYHTFLLVDEDTYNSLYIQLGILENYDSRYFEKVISTPQAKIYKLKI
jgi:dolichyl-diphosphooligosaccharide--protein glycosyltransferase/undecaprenyl-diphosphooligosaccharide--protein glycosyltransferase